MEKLKTVLTFMLGGAFLGNVTAMLTAPQFISWYNSTPLATQTVCDLSKVVTDVSSQLIRAQLIGAVTGAVAFLVLGIVIVRARSRKQQPPAPTPKAG